MSSYLDRRRSFCLLFFISILIQNKYLVSTSAASSTSSGRTYSATKLPRPHDNAIGSSKARHNKFSILKRPFRLIDSQGRVSPNARVTEYLQTLSTSSPKSYVRKVTDEGVSIVGVIDCRAKGGSRCLNDILNTNFCVDDAGVSMTMLKSHPSCVLYTAFQATAAQSQSQSQSLSACHSIDFFSEVSSAVCVIIPAEESSESLGRYDALFTRLAWKICEATWRRPGDKINIHIALETPTAGSDSSTSESNYQEACDVMKKKMVYFQRQAAESFSSLTSSLGASAPAFSDFLTSVHISVLNTSDPQAAATLKGMLLDQYDTNSTLIRSEAYSSGSGKRVTSLNRLPSLLLDAWEKVSAPTPPEAQLSPAELESLYAVETAYAVASQQIDVKLGQWRSRVNSGKIIGSFGSRVVQFLERVQKAYMARTEHSLVVRERSLRLRQLREALSLSVSALHQQQMIILQARVANGLRNKLIKLTETADPEGCTPEKMNDALQEFIYILRTEASDLAVDSFDIGNSKDELLLNTISLLEKLCETFPESAAAKVAAIRRMEKQVSAPPPKGKRSVNVALSIVALLRPPGLGSFQGFLNYATKVFGVPLQLLLGTINDGDASSEIQGENSLLRLQPKFHFDINL